MEPLTSRATRYRIEGGSRLYSAGDPVGKSTTQVGVSVSGNEIVSRDTELYEKWGQCLASLHEMVDEINDLDSGGGPGLKCLAIPFVVVPNGRLWMTRFDADGRRIGDPERVDRCPAYAGMEIDAGPFSASLRVSHVEIVTRDGLVEFVRRNLLDTERFRHLFGQGDG